MRPRRCASGLSTVKLRANEAFLFPRRRVAQIDRQLRCIRRGLVQRPRFQDRDPRHGVCERLDWGTAPRTELASYRQTTLFADLLERRKLTLNAEGFGGHYPIDRPVRSGLLATAAAMTKGDGQRAVRREIADTTAKTAALAEGRLISSHHLNPVTLGNPSQRAALSEASRRLSACRRRPATRPPPAPCPGHNPGSH